MTKQYLFVEQLCYNLDLEMHFNRVLFSFSVNDCIDKVRQY